MTDKREFTIDDFIRPETPPRIGPNEAEQHAEAIAKVNDEARRNLISGKKCQVIMTRAVALMPQLELVQIIILIQEYENWTRGNDTYAERDFGVLKKVNDVWTQEPQGENFKGDTIFFKMDYYSKADPNYGSEHPEDAELTKRVLTIMFAQEY